uniref:Uncharacterized protein n=1 Tax=Rhizophora mucronata TaxID=61149 RepID=A0A2P2Q9T0_RHIMU
MIIPLYLRIMCAQITDLHYSVLLKRVPSHDTHTLSSFSVYYHVVSCLPMMGACLGLQVYAAFCYAHTCMLMCNHEPVSM